MLKIVNAYSIFYNLLYNILCKELLKGNIMTMPQLLGVEKSIIEGNQEIGFTLIYMIPNCDPEQKNIFMQYCIENDCTIQRIVWVSRFDRTEISVIEPVVYDAYNCVISVKSNDINKLFNIEYLFAKRLDKIKYLEKCLGDGKSCMEIEQEKSPINYEKLASSILASLYHPQ